MSSDEAAPATPEESPPARNASRRGSRRRERRQERVEARRRDGRLDYVALGGVTLLVLLGPMLLGGAFPWATSILAGLAAATLLACGLSSSTTSEERAPAVFAVALVLLGWTALQALPLPSMLTRLVSPSSVEDAEISAALLGHAAPSFVALSRAPGATWTELLKCVAALSAMYAGYLLARRGYRLWVLSACAASGALLAVVAFAHLLAGAHTVFGLYAPVHASAEVLGPLLNTNHLGGVMAFSVPIATGLAMTHTDRRARIAWVLCAIACAGVCALVRSRGAFGALVLGSLALVGWALTRSRRAGQSPARQWAALAATGIVAASLAGAVYLGWDLLLPKFVAPGGASKLDVAFRGLRLVADAPLTGVGRGAFGDVFVRVYGDTSRITHPENIVVQWLAEWGLPIGLAALAAFGGALVRTVARLRSPARAGALFGIVALVTQNLVDFSLEMSGVVVLVTVALGAVLAPRTEAPGPARGLPLRSLARVAGVAGLVCVASLAPFVDRWSVAALEARLRASQTRVDRTEFRAALATALKMHPSEPTFPLLAAADALRRQSRDAPAWLNRAMVLAPRWVASHLLAAAWLRSRDRSAQAWLEVREAARLSPARAAGSVCELRGSDASLAGFETSAPLRSAERIPYLRALAACLPLMSAEAVRVDAMLDALHADGEFTRRRTARRALAHGEAAAALRLLQAIPPARRTDEDSALLVDALVRVNRPRDALRELDRALARAHDSRLLLEQKARIQASLGDALGMRATMAARQDTGAGDPAALAAAQQLLGDLELQLANPARALAAYEQAHTYSGNDAVLASVGVAAERLGNRRRALAAWEQLCTTLGPTAAACGERDRLQSLERPGDLQQPTAGEPR